MEEFLSQVKQLIKKPNGFQFIKRRKNMKALNKHGLTIDIAKMYIRSLKVINYFEGPVEDRDLSGYVWKFGKIINGKMFYIKLKIKKEKLLCCISFHDAEYEIESFPFKE